MLNNLPEEYGQLQFEESSFEKAAPSTTQTPARPGAPASRIDCRALQKVWKARLPLPERQGTWTGLLPIGDSRGWENAFVLRSSETEEARCSVPQEQLEAPKAQRTGCRNQPSLARARRAWRLRLGPRRGGPLKEFTLPGISRSESLAIGSGSSGKLEVPLSPWYLTV